MATREQIKRILSLLATLPNCPITSKETADLVNDMYIAALSDVPEEYLQGAYLQYISTDNRFFPSNPGTLREIAFDLEMTAQGIPTASQAWAMVNRGPEMISAVWCDMGQQLREKSLSTDPENYWSSIRAYGYHVDHCDVCMPTSKAGSYGSKVVDEVVRMMGGRDLIFTENAVADRARFFEGYRELVLNERRKMQMVPSVRAFIESESRPSLVGSQVSSLAGRLGSGGGR